MALRRPDEQNQASAKADAIYFPMEDLKTGDQVTCKINYSYLQKRTRLHEGPLSGEAMLPYFETLRDEIESIASEKYAAGELSPSVTTADLSKG